MQDPHENKLIQFQSPVCGPPQFSHMITAFSVLSAHLLSGALFEFVLCCLTSSLSSYCSMSFLSLSASSMFSCLSLVLWALCCSICISISLKVIWKCSMASFLCSSYSLDRWAFSSCQVTDVGTKRRSTRSLKRGREERGEKRKQVENGKYRSISAAEQNPCSGSSVMLAVSSE